MPAAHRQAQTYREIAAANAAYATCAGQLGPFIKAITRMNSKLEVGMREAEYSSEVADVNAVYEEIPFKQLQLACLAVGVQAEKVFKEHIRSENEWQSCIEKLECEASSIKSDLQRHWSAASREVGEAEERLAAIRKPA